MPAVRHSDPGSTAGVSPLQGRGLPGGRQEAELLNLPALTFQESSLWKFQRCPCIPPPPAWGSGGDSWPGAGGGHCGRPFAESAGPVAGKGERVFPSSAVCIYFSNRSVHCRVNSENCRGSSSSCALGPADQSAIRVLTRTGSATRSSPGTVEGGPTKRGCRHHPHPMPGSPTSSWWSSQSGTLRSQTGGHHIHTAPGAAGHTWLHIPAGIH